MREPNHKLLPLLEDKAFGTFLHGRHLPRGPIRWGNRGFEGGQESLQRGNEVDLDELEGGHRP